MFSKYACINGCNVCINISMDVMFECRYICMHACVCMYVCMYASYSKFHYLMFSYQIVHWREPKNGIEFDPTRVAFTNI